MWGYRGSPDVAVQMALLLTRMADICILQHFLQPTEKSRGVFPAPPIPLPSVIRAGMVAGAECSTSPFPHSSPGPVLFALPRWLCHECCPSRWVLLRGLRERQSWSDKRGSRGTAACETLCCCGQLRHRAGRNAGRLTQSSSATNADPPESWQPRCPSPSRHQNLHQIYHKTEKGRGGSFTYPSSSSRTELPKRQLQVQGKTEPLRCTG